MANENLDYLEPTLEDSELMGSYSETWDSDAVKEAQRGLAIGTIIKLCLKFEAVETPISKCDGERMWFTVTEVVEGGYIATCSNTAVFKEEHGVDFDDRVRFEPRHVLAIYREDT